MVCERLACGYDDRVCPDRPSRRTHLDTASIGPDAVDRCPLVHLRSPPRGCPRQVQAGPVGVEHHVTGRANAAQNLGATPAAAFLKIVFPLSLPGVAAGSILVFTVAMNAYATPFLLGGPSFKMMAPVLYKQIAVASNWPFGAAMAFILIAVTFAVSIVATSMLAKQYKAK